MNAQPETIGVIASVLKQLYPQNPDIVIGRESRRIAEALIDDGILDEPGRCPNCRLVPKHLYECEHCGYHLLPRLPEASQPRWWVIAEGELLAALRRAVSTDPEVLMVELLANARSESS